MRKWLIFVFILSIVLNGCIYYYKHDKMLMGSTTLSWVEKGMSKERVISIAGEPSRKNIKSDRKEVWVYTKEGITLTFIDDKLETIESFGVVLMD